MYSAIAAEIWAEMAAVAIPKKRPRPKKTMMARVQEKTTTPSTTATMAPVPAEPDKKMTRAQEEATIRTTAPEQAEPDKTTTRAQETAPETAEPRDVWLKHMQEHFDLADLPRRRRRRRKRREEEEVEPVAQKKKRTEEGQKEDDDSEFVPDASFDYF